MHACSPKTTLLVIQTSDLSLLAGGGDVSVMFRVDKGEVFERDGYVAQGTQFTVVDDIAPIVQQMLAGEKIAVRVNSGGRTWTHTFSLVGFTRASEEVRRCTGKDLTPPDVSGP